MRLPKARISSLCTPLITYAVSLQNGITKLTVHRGLPAVRNSDTLTKNVTEASHLLAGQSPIATQQLATLASSLIESVNRIASMLRSRFIHALEEYNEYPILGITSGKHDNFHAVRHYATFTRPIIEFQSGFVRV
nr:hypothetical protein CFP56_74659 [Quercus suber]